MALKSRPEIAPIAAFETNYIWAVHDDRHCLLVDPGSAAECLDFLERRQLALSAIVLTHHHADHIGGVDDLLAHTPVDVWGPADPRMPQVDQPVGEGDRVRVKAPDLELSVLATPGHTSTHLVYHDHHHLFAGDTLFSAGCGRLFEGSGAQMLDSLDKLSDLPDAMRLYCAHEYTQANCRFALEVEPDNAELRAWSERVAQLRGAGCSTLPSTLALERAVNPFLRTRQPAVIEAANRHAPGTGEEPAAVFTVIRHWKDQC